MTVETTWYELSKSIFLEKYSKMLSGEILTQHTMLKEMYFRVKFCFRMCLKAKLTLFLLSMTCPVLANSVDPDQLA